MRQVGIYTLQMERECSFGVWPRGNLEAFRFSREDLQPEPLKSPIRPGSQFRLNNVKCPVLLLRINDMPPYGVRGQIGDLQARRIMLFVHEPDVQIGHAANRIAARE